MKKILALLAVFLLLITAYVFGTFRGSTTINVPDAKWVDNSEAAKAWQAFIVSKEAAAARLIQETSMVNDRLAGFDFLSDLAGFVVEMKVDKGSTQDPKFTNWMGDHRKFLGDVGDAIYQTAEIDPRYDYVIKGKINDADYVGFQLYGTSPIGWNRTAGHLSDKNLLTSKAGEFELLLSAKSSESTTNHLHLSSDVHKIMVRQYFFERKHSQPAELTITNLSPETPKPLSEADYAKRLQAATQTFNDIVDATFALRKMLLKAPNSFDAPREFTPALGGVYYPTDDNTYLGGVISLKPDEAVIIEGKVPEFATDAIGYWSVSIQNLWLQSLDYENYQTSLNNRQIKTRADDTYRFVISQRAPAENSKLALLIGDDNWLETAGFSEALMAIRYQLATDFEKPKIRLLKLEP